MSTRPGRAGDGDSQPLLPQSLVFCGGPAILTVLMHVVYQMHPGPTVASKLVPLPLSQLGRLEGQPPPPFRLAQQSGRRRPRRSAGPCDDFAAVIPCAREAALCGAAGRVPSLARFGGFS
jgi:hypothetical protein